MRQWIGTVLIAAIGLAVGLVGVASSMHTALLAILIVGFVAGTLLSMPTPHRFARVCDPPLDAEPGQGRTTTFRGEFTGSTFDHIDSNADVVFDGTVRESVIANIIHRVGKKK